MTSDIDTLLSLAREVGGRHMEKYRTVQFTEQELASFAERIRQDERERAARICESQQGGPVIVAVAKGCAAAIRSSCTSQSNPLLGGGNG